MSGRGHEAVGDAEDISGLDAAGRLQQHLIWQGDVIEAVSHFSACQQGLVGVIIVRLRASEVIIS